MASKKKRVRNWTPEDRAAHRVFEKSRREAFNDSLIDLARQVPSLATARRLNKHMIVDHSIARLQSQRNMCLAAADEARGLIAERDQLLAEVNHWRASSGAPFTAAEASPLGHNLETLMEAETETFGTFPNGFGDNTPDGYVGEDLGEDGSEEAGAIHVPAGQGQPRQRPANGTTYLGQQIVSPTHDTSEMEDFIAPSAFTDLYGLEGILEDGSTRTGQHGQTSGGDMLPVGSGPDFPAQFAASTAQMDSMQLVFDFQDPLTGQLPENAFLDAGLPFDDQLLLSSNYFNSQHPTIFQT
ncbi:hypothetical protein BDV96DRAFT_653243 [Lophiotrema nucula]|uniref:BHLH domain-containing protein n=1 Tax=Lophiotrema nucula TaxID=690887 RepID=A0A6A5YNT2_9PLEO|nr:hypothetical protein BDV96DRAFT_653243 [Lophiotrema nucula]